MLNLTPFLHLYRAYRSAQLKAQNPAKVQERQLLSLLKTAEMTRFGVEHGFQQMNSVADYQRRVPLRYYEDFWKNYWQLSFPTIQDATWPGVVPYFPVTSGTTSGTTKYIPYSAEMQKSNTKAGLDLLVHHLNNRPKSKIFGGKSFILGGSTELIEESPGIFSGDLSGIAVKTLPWWAKPRYFPPEELALLKNWEEKIDILAKQSLKEPIAMISGVPSWMLLFFSKLFELCPEAGGTLAGVYPDLEMVVHGGVNFTPYVDQFTRLMEGSKAELREVYPASEGFIGVADRGPGEGLRLNLDIGLFFEFVPVDELEDDNPTRHWIGNVEEGVNYAIILTTCAGLWSYVIGDTVTFIDTKTPRVLITGRTSYSLSAFGEHLIEDELQDGLAHASQATGLRFTDYSVGAQFPATPEDLGGHVYVIEFTDQFVTRRQRERFAQALDARLIQRNEDYESHRADGFGLKAPEIQAVKPGFFTEWMKSRGKLGGQNKVPRVINDSSLFEHLLSAASQQEAQSEDSEPTE